ncbi:MAG TPA: demethoxyubiquinone hydroxylase family protein [Ktedonobacterales bacterium]|nr:demethoxyubiquinone hydroxylase family protein [Ktedonobacterales bacterium]
MSETEQQPPSATDTTNTTTTNTQAADGNGAHAQLIAALRQNWRREVEGARMYRDLAARESDPNKRGVLERLAEAEERHAAKWERKLAELGAAPPPLTFTWRDRLQRWINRGIGTDAALRRMEAAEDQDIARYEAHARAVSDTEAAQMLREVRREEEAHGRVIREMIAPEGPQSMLDVMLRRERWHKRGGGWIGDAIYGANDGLGAVFGIVSGVAGATAGNNQAVLIAGLAGMLASALSMGSGAYLATKSEREIYQAEIDRERREIEEDPEEEKEELALFYQLKGFSEAESQTLADRLSKQPEQFLNALAHEELGLNQESFPNPLVAALSATLSTGFGAFIPIIPFFFLGGIVAVIWAAGISLAAHFAVGAAKTIITGRSWLVSGAEMTVVGAIEAVITYLLGVLFHVAGA